MMARFRRESCWRLLPAFGLVALLSCVTLTDDQAKATDKRAQGRSVLDAKEIVAKLQIRRSEIRDRSAEGTAILKGWTLRRGEKKRKEYTSEYEFAFTKAGPQYWLRSSSEGRALELAFDGQRLRHLIEQENGDGEEIRTGCIHEPYTDGWVYRTYAFVPFWTEYVPFPEANSLLDRVLLRSDVVEASLTDEGLIQLDCSEELGHHQLFVDPQRDYCLVKMHAVREPGHPAMHSNGMDFCESVIEVTEFTKIGGRFLPSKALRTFDIKYLTFTKHEEQQLDYSWVSVNASPGPDRFMLKFPPGTRVHDFQAKAEYRVDEAGKLVMDEAAKKAAERNRKREQEQAALIGIEAPEIEAAALLNCGPIDLAQLRGDCVLLVFWALGCEPCRWEVGLIQRYDAIPELADMHIISVHRATTDETSVAQVKAFCEEKGITYPVILDAKGPEGAFAGETFGRYRVYWYPDHVLIGPDRKVVSRGHFTDLVRDARRLLRLRQQDELQPSVAGP